jgi:hypothetical protein
MKDKPLCLKKIVGNALIFLADWARSEDEIFPSPDL